MLIKKITKYGNSNWILIPNDFLNLFNLKSGDKVNISLENGKIIITPIKSEQ